MATTGSFRLERAFRKRSFRELINSYFGLRLPSLKVVVTGSGRVAHGVLEIMNLMEIHEVSRDICLEKKYTYPVYTQLKGADLYQHKRTGKYSREEFHLHPELYQCKFLPYAAVADILMNGVYWEKAS